MADNQTQLVINIDAILRGLDKTLKGLAQVEKSLKSVTAVKLAGGSASIDKMAQSAAKLAVQAQELANRQAKAALTADRLALAQLKLEAAFARAAGASAKASQAQDRAAKAQEISTKRAAAEVARINAQTARQAEQQAAIRERAAKSISGVETREAQRGADAFAASLGQEAEAAQALNKRLQSLGNGLRSVGQGAVQIGLALSAAITVPLVALARTATNAAVEMDSLKRGLTAIVGSADEAATQLKRLTEIAKLPGIGFQEAIQGSIRLQAVGFSAEQAEKALIQFSNAIALTGGGRDELERITVQLGQLAAKGKVLSQDLRPIIEAAPAVGKALKEAFGTVNADDIQALGLTTEEFFNILITQLGKLPRASAGAKNAFENFRDSVFRAAAAVGEGLLPILGKLIDTVGPIITVLAEQFQRLPRPLQTAVVLIGALAAALGPVTVIFGALTTGIGRAIVGFAQLNALGLIPTIANLRLLGQVMVGTASLAEGAAATTAVAAGGWIALALALGAVVTAIALYVTAETKAIVVDTAAAKARLDRLKATEKELEFLSSLIDKVTLTADEQKKLAESYAAVSGEAKGRIALMDDEKSKLDALIQSKKEQLRIDQFAAQATSVQLVENVIKALNDETKAQQALTKAKQDFQAATLSAATASSNIFGARQLQVTDILEQQKKASLEAADALEEIGKAKKSVDDAAKAIVELSEASGVSTETLLQQAQAAGADKAQVDAVRKAIEEFTRSQKDSVPATDDATKALRDQIRAFQELADAAEKAEKTRNVLIKGAITSIRESATDFKDARRQLDELIKKTPELGKAIEKERKGKAIQDFLEEQLGLKRSRDKLGTSLRNAQEQLSKSLADVAEASAGKLAGIEKNRNDRLLQENENAFKLQLISYRQYLNERAFLTSKNIQLEIDAQQRIVDEAVATQKRFQARTGLGIPAAERARARAGAADAEQKQIRAQIKINELIERQHEITVDADQALAEEAKQQERDVRQLTIEYATLKGSIEDALKAATVEKFREKLLELGKAQDDITKRLKIFKDLLSAEQIQELETARERNQTQIDTIQGIIRQEDALTDLAVAEKFVERAKQAQADLEKQIGLDVELRGESEIEAVRRRLQGEEKLRNSLLIARDIVQETIDKLANPPLALLDFIKQLNLELQGLGQLGFTERFRLAQREFDRLNDERLAKIAEVELAVRKRDIAEAEGLLLIRRINGDYVDDLQKQVNLLTQIAAASNNPDLIKQARDAQIAVRDATEEIADFGKQLRAAGIDAFQQAFEDFFVSLFDNTKTAKEKLLDFVNSIATSIERVIAENLSKKLIESILGTGGATGGGGIIDFIKGIFGGGGGGAIAGGAGAGAGAAAASTAASAPLTAAATTAGAALTTGGAAAGTSMAAGGATFAASVAAAGAAFAAAVAAAGAAFAAAVSASAATSAIGGIAGNVPVPAAMGDLLTPRPGGRLIKVAEAGHAEAVLTTDPKHAARQFQLLREYLQRTRGLFGRIEGFASGGMVESGMLNSIERTSAAMPGLSSLAGSGREARDLRLRQILVDQRSFADWVNTPEGEKVIVEKLVLNAPLIRRISNRRN